MEKPLANILTIDLEDWHSLVHRRLTGILPPPSQNIFRQTERLLGLLEQYQTKATFFTLGVLAEYHPDLVRKISAQGHEIASHGYAHRRVNELSRESFREDAQQSKALLEDIIGLPVLGYRATEFSIVRQTLWAIEVLAELGFLYDSSIFPIYHRRYGIPDFPSEIKQYRLWQDLRIIEFPLAVYSWGRLRLPMAGGGYFRLLPFGLISAMARSSHNQNQPLVTYFHPYEFDPRPLDVFEIFHPRNQREKVRSWRYNLLSNLRRSTVFHKLEKTLENMKFITCQEYLARNEPKEESLIITLA